MYFIREYIFPAFVGNGGFSNNMLFLVFPIFLEIKQSDYSESFRILESIIKRHLCKFGWKKPRQKKVMNVVQN